MRPKRRRRYTADFKAEVALAALTERPPLAKLAARSQLAPAHITRWKQHVREQAAQVKRLPLISRFQPPSPPT